MYSPTSCPMSDIILYLSYNQRYKIMKFVTIFLLVFTLSCGMYQQSITKSYDKYRDVSSTTLQLPFIIDGGFGTVWIYFRKTQKNNYYVHVKLSTLNWWFVNEMIFLSDGKRIKLKSAKSSRNVIASNHVQEFITMTTKKSDVEKIANSDKTTVLVSGSKRQMEIEFKKNHLLKIREFLDYE